MSLRARAAAAVVLAIAGCRPGPPPPAAPPPPPPPAPPPARVWSGGSSEVAVLMYHDILSQPTLWFDLATADFERQLQRLREAGAAFVTLDQVTAHLRDGAPLPPRAVALTFDQGTLGLYTDAWPVLKRLGYPATFFVHTGYVGRPSPTKEHVTWAQLRELAASGLVDVQPLTVSFPPELGALSDESLRRELVDSKAAVEREVGRPVRYTAYPYGVGSERVATAIQAAGYVAAFNEVRAPCASPADRYFLPRYNPKRIDEIIARWGQAAPAAGLVTGALTAGGQPPSGLAWRGGWPQAVPADPQRLLPSDGDSLACYHLLLAGGRFQKLADARELRGQGRPLLVGNQRRYALAPYRRWMSASAAALGHLVEAPNYAVIGAHWLVRDGLEQPGGPAHFERPALAAIDSAGGLWWAKASGRPSRPQLLQAVAGLPQVVVLNEP